MARHIVQVTSLAEFCAEVPTPVHVAGETKPNLARLSLIERNTSYSGQLQIPGKVVELSLQGTNPRNEIVWLMWSFDFSFPDDEFMNRSGHSIYRQMPMMHNRVTDWLQDKGYQVLGGRYALPKSIAPLQGRFECIKWVKCGDGDGIEYKLEAG
jgi:hypothetical protein